MPRLIKSLYQPGQVVQVFDTYAGGTDDEISCHKEIGIVEEQLSIDRYLVAMPKHGMETIHIDWLREPNLFLVKADILNDFHSGEPDDPDGGHTTWACKVCNPE
jgi:hypothetical protein